MPFYTAPEYYKDHTPQTSNMETMGSAFTSQFNKEGGAWLTRKWQEHMWEETGTLDSQEDIDGVYSTYYGVSTAHMERLGIEIPEFTESTSRKEAEMHAFSAAREWRSQLEIASAEKGWGASTASFVGTMGGSLSDPVNFASMFIPVVGPEKLIAMAAKYGPIRARAMAAAAEGAVGAVLAEPFQFYNEKYLGVNDYDLQDSLTNIAFSTAFGMGIRVPGGMLFDKFAKRSGGALSQQADAYSRHLKEAEFFPQGRNVEGNPDIGALDVDADIAARIQQIIEGVGSENDLSVNVNYEKAMRMLHEGIEGWMDGRTPDAKLYAEFYAIEKLLKEGRITPDKADAMLRDAYKRHKQVELDPATKYVNQGVSLHWRADDAEAKATVGAKPQALVDEELGGVGAVTPEEARALGEGAEEFAKLSDDMENHINAALKDLEGQRKVPNEESGTKLDKSEIFDDAQSDKARRKNADEDMARQWEEHHLRKEESAELRAKEDAFEAEAKAEADAVKDYHASEKKRIAAEKAGENNAEARAMEMEKLAQNRMAEEGRMEEKWKAHDDEVQRRKALDEEAEAFEAKNGSPMTAAFDMLYKCRMENGPATAIPATKPAQKAAPDTVKKAKPPRKPGIQDVEKVVDAPTRRAERQMEFNLEIEKATSGAMDDTFIVKVEPPEPVKAKAVQPIKAKEVKEKSQKPNKLVRVSPQEAVEGKTVYFSTPRHKLKSKVPKPLKAEKQAIDIAVNDLANKTNDAIEEGVHIIMNDFFTTQKDNDASSVLKNKAIARDEMNNAGIHFNKEGEIYQKKDFGQNREWWGEKYRDRSDNIDRAFDESMQPKAEGTVKSAPKKSTAFGDLNMKVLRKMAKKRKVAGTWKNKAQLVEALTNFEKKDLAKKAAKLDSAESTLKQLTGMNEKQTKVKKAKMNEAERLKQANMEKQKVKAAKVNYKAQLLEAMDDGQIVATVNKIYNDFTKSVDMDLLTSGNRADLDVFRAQVAEGQKVLRKSVGDMKYRGETQTRIAVDPSVALHAGFLLTAADRVDNVYKAETNGFLGDMKTLRTTLVKKMDGYNDDGTRKVNIDGFKSPAALQTKNILDGDTED